MRGIEYGGTAVEKKDLQDAITGEMVYILAISLCLVVAILLITSESWLEPFILLAASGVAVLLNRGTNVMFGEISYITNSIAVILQLALSIDYSIVLLYAYRRQKETTTDTGAAMKAAILSVIKPVSASALTTIAGLPAFLFMSFRIGFDIGIVLMKGIVISAITSLTLLPALVLLLATPIRKAKKKAFVPKGKAFCKTAYKAGKFIVPVALALVVLCGVLQTGNRYIFTDTKVGNQAIVDTFGKNNAVVAVYKNTDDTYANEQQLAQALKAHTTADGTPVLASYTAYSNTVREPYDAQKAVQRLELSAADTELLFTMYNLYQDPTAVQLSFAEFVDLGNELVSTDADAKEFVDADTTKTLQTLQVIAGVMSGSQTADQLFTKLTTGVMQGTDVQKFSIQQLYGLYFYDWVAEKAVDFQTMLQHMIAAGDNENLKSTMDSATVAQLQALQAGIAQFNTQMETPMSQKALQGWVYQNYGVLLSDMQLVQIYGGYFAATGQPAGETIPFLPLMKFLAANNLLPDAAAVQTVAGYDALYQTVHAAYGYEEFLPTLSTVATALTGQTPQIAVTAESVQQLYILYFYGTGAMPVGSINGRVFAQYALTTDTTNAVVHANLTDENRNKLADMLTVDRYYTDAAPLTYPQAYEKLTALQKENKSDMASSQLDEDKISGVYIKSAVRSGQPLTAEMRACELLDFVSGNMDTNTLLKEKMSEENRQKVADAQSDIAKAEDLFNGERYSRMLLSVNLPNESEETTAFVDYLIQEVKTVFGDDAYITGEIVSTYDLEQSFSHDNLFITVFTLISIFVIVLVIFRSLSLPIILVAVIQGAIFIAMSTQLLGDGIFFMSYIVTTCILMGATIDYGILMSSNYVAYRQTNDRATALRLSVEAAMPTVFSSGLILTVCGFVIHFISSQNSISTVGLLIGIGTICLVVMITVVLPSVLYLLDAFVLKLSIRKK